MCGSFFVCVSVCMWVNDESIICALCVVAFLWILNDNRDIVLTVSSTHSSIESKKEENNRKKQWKYVRQRARFLLKYINRPREK